MNTAPGTTGDTPPAVDTVTFAEPEPAGDVAVNEVGEVTVTFVAGVDPKLTVLPDVKPVPVIVTTVPPAAGPDDGAIPVTVGAAMKVNTAAGTTGDGPPTVVTVTFAVPEPAGDVAVNDVGDTTVTFVAGVDPKLTVLPEVKPVPVIVTPVPPDAGPEDGASPDTDGLPR